MASLKPLRLRRVVEFPGLTQRTPDRGMTRHRRIEAALDQVVDQCLHHGAVFGCPFHQSERVLEALAIDPERRHQHKMLTDVDAVAMMSSPDRSAPIHSFMRSAYNATKCRQAADRPLHRRQYHMPVIAPRFAAHSTIAR